jgi:hypothetical protein
VEPDPKSQVLAYMHNGESVKVISVEGNWWLIDRAGVVGYARAKYMQMVGCGK